MHIPADNPVHRATIDRALQSEAMKVRANTSSGEFDFDHEIVVTANEAVVARFMLETSERHTTIVIQQFGIGMLDGLQSLQLMDSQKPTRTNNVFGGEYGIGFKQLLAVTAKLQNEDWNFVMYGSVYHEASQVHGWSKLSSSSIQGQLNVHGEVCNGSIVSEVIFVVIIMDCNFVLVEDVRSG